MTTTIDTPAEREKDVLLAHLDDQRRHVLGILDGLSDDQLRRPVLPSGWHCLGLVQHLALSDERYWFGCVVAGGPFDALPSGPDEEWQVDQGQSVVDVFGRYRQDIRRSNEIIAATPLDAAPKQPDPAWASWGIEFPDLRSILTHVLVETSVHAGHLDAVRELIDGRQWVVL